MTRHRLSILLVALSLPLAACGQSNADETSGAEPDSAEAAAAETPAEAERETSASTERETTPSTEQRRAEPREEEPPRTPTARVRSVPAGTQVQATLLDSLDSEAAQAGDRFSAEVNASVTDGAYVLVPAGSRLFGHLTEVRPTRGDSAAVIAVAFDSLQVREQTLPVAASVTGVELESRSEMKDEGKKIGIGAAAGALIGAVVGKDVKWAIIGAAGGAAAGTAIALGTQARYAVLPAGSEMTLNLDESLEVRLPAEE
ncbi:MAG: hypothetical protein ACOC83_08960 [Gemmatimonadota bacterium]